MKNISRHYGYVRVIDRLNCSKNGNPRYKLFIEGEGGTGVSCVTKPDSMVAYLVPNYRDKWCQVDVGTHRGFATVDKIESVV